MCWRSADAEQDVSSAVHRSTAAESSWASVAVDSGSRRGRFLLVVWLVLRLRIATSKKHAGMYGLIMKLEPYKKPNNQ